MSAPLLLRYAPPVCVYVFGHLDPPAIDFGCSLALSVIHMWYLFVEHLHV
jgi:hypothetical protein